MVSSVVNAQVCLSLVRHGQSEWNAVGRLQGQTEHIGLTGVGRRQATAAARYLAGHSVDILLTSDLVRATQTADAVSDAVGLVATRDRRLREQGFGFLEGLALSDAARDRVHAAPPGIRPGGGESIDDVRRRVGALLREHLDAARGRATRGIVLVTHGQTIRAALSWLRTAGDARFPPTVPANGSITTVYLTDGRVTAHHTVVPSLDPGLDTGTTVTDGVDAGGGVW